MHGGPHTGCRSGCGGLSRRLLPPQADVPGARQDGHRLARTRISSGWAADRSWERHVRALLGLACEILTMTRGLPHTALRFWFRVRA